MRQITTAGGLVTTNPVIIDLNAADSSPSISKSCGQSNGLPAQWLIAWQRTLVVADCFGRFVTWHGALPTNVFNQGSVPRAMQRRVAVLGHVRRVLRAGVGGRFIPFESP